jgi:hypothetical protein
MFVADEPFSRGGTKFLIAKKNFPSNQNEALKI